MTVLVCALYSVQYLYRVYLIGGKYIKDTLNKVQTREEKTGAVRMLHAQLKEILGTQLL
jgi:hypothetical protein